MKTEKLGNCCLIKGGFAFKSELYQNKGTPIIRISNIIDERIIINNNTVYFKGNNNELKDYNIKFGDILIALSGATTGKFGIYDSHKEALLNQRVGLIRTNENKLYNKYLFYFLFRIRNKIFNKAQGVAQPNLSNSDLENTKIPLPPLSEQKQITETLDKVDNLRQKRKQSIQLLDDYIKSVFYNIFGNPVINQFKFKKGKIKDLVTDVKYGTSSPAEENGKYPYLRMNNITYDGYMDLEDLKYINIDDNYKEKYSVRKNDLLFNRTNSKELVGKTGIFNEDREMIIAGYLIRVRTNNLANPWYIWGCLNSLHGKKVLLSMCKSIIGMANINAQELQNIDILIPPINLQNQFAKTVQKSLHLKSKMEESLKEIENLFNSLMQKYFSNN